MLDNNSPVPLYYQLKAYIEDQIHAGRWKAGERVPSENELGGRFGVSRTTVRQALGDLVHNGLLRRVQGRGTFVAEPRVQQRLVRLTSFTQDMHLRGQQPSARVLCFEVTQGMPKIALGFGLPPEGEVILLKRLRIADGTPMAIETAYLLYPLCKDLLDEDLSANSLYHLLAAKLNVIPTSAHQQLEAARCPAFEARLLEIPKGSPVLHIFRATNDQYGRVIEQVESFYRGDRYIFHADLAI